MHGNYQVSHNDGGDVVLCYGQGDTVTLDGCHNFDHSWVSAHAGNDQLWAG